MDGKEIVCTEIRRIDRKNAVFYRFYGTIIDIASPGTDNRETKQLVKKAIRAVSLLDSHSETGNNDFLTEGNALLEQVISVLEENDQVFVRNLRRFFDIENGVWNRHLTGEIVSNKEIGNYMALRASDSLFYAIIIRQFYPIDAKKLCFAHMKLMDIWADLNSIENDHKTNQPNLIALKLGQIMDVAKIPADKSNTLKLARAHGIDLVIKRMADNIVASADETEFADKNALEFITANIRAVRTAIDKAL